MFVVINKSNKQWKSFQTIRRISSNPQETVNAQFKLSHVDKAHPNHEWPTYFGSNASGESFQKVIRALSIQVWIFVNSFH